WGVHRSALEGGLETAVHWPRALDARWPSKLATALILVLTLGVPTLSMVLAIQLPRSPWTLWRTFQPQIFGSLQLALAAGAVTVLVGLGTMVRHRRWTLALALTAFVLGGELLAIGLIRLYNRP